MTTALWVPVFLSAAVWQPVKPSQLMDELPTVYRQESSGAVIDRFATKSKPVDAGCHKYYGAEISVSLSCDSRKK